MALEPQELVVHQKVNLDGEPGTVMAHDAQITFVGRDSGKVELYKTDYVSENGEMFADSGSDGEGEGGNGKPPGPNPGPPATEPAATSRSRRSE